MIRVKLISAPINLSDPYEQFRNTIDLNDKSDIREWLKCNFNEEQVIDLLHEHNWFLEERIRKYQHTRPDDVEIWKFIIKLNLLALAVLRKEASRLS